MATFKRIKKEFEKEIKEIRNAFSIIEQWAKDNELKLKSVSEKSGKLDGNEIKYSEKRKYSREANKDISHDYEVSISIEGKKDKEFKGKVKISIVGEIGDSEKDNPRFSGFRMLKRRFIDVFLKPYDYRKTKEFEKTIDDLEERFK